MQFYYLFPNLALVSELLDKGCDDVMVTKFPLWLFLYKQGVRRDMLPCREESAARRADYVRVRAFECVRVRVHVVDYDHVEKFFSPL